MTPLFGPPRVSALKARRDTNRLVRMLSYEKDSLIRKEAAQALADLGAAEALHELASRLIAEDDYEVRGVLVETLDKLGWTPQRDKASARYWRLKGEWLRCGECGDDGLQELLPLLLEGSYQVAEAYTQLGERAMHTLLAVANKLFEKYREIASMTPGIDYRSGAGRNTAEALEAVVSRLQYCITTIGGFQNPRAELFLANLYRQVKQSIYSSPEGGFSDLFGAVGVRQGIVLALRKAETQGAVDLLVEVLNRDAAEAVRRAAVDVLEDVSERLPAVLASPAVKRALEGALAKESAGVSSRAGAIRELLAKSE